MDDKKKSEEDVQETPKQGSGSLLAAARKLQKKTVEDIARELNLSVTQIRTIELDQSEGLPEPTYVRGYIRLYARVLGLDVDEVLSHYLNPNWQQGARLDDMPKGIGSAYESDPRGFFTPGKIVLIIMLIALMVFLWLTGKFDTILDRQTTVAAPTNLSRVNTSTVNTSTSSNDESLVLQKAVAGEQDTGSVLEGGVAENQLDLTFSGTSWVDIRDADGGRLAYKSYTKGDKVTVSAPLLMSVFLGNAKAVTASLNGEPYDVAKHREGVFARFTIGDAAQ